MDSDSEDEEPFRGPLPSPSFPPKRTSSLPNHLRSDVKMQPRKRSCVIQTGDQDKDDILNHVRKYLARLMVFERERDVGLHVIRSWFKKTLS